MTAYDSMRSKLAPLGIYAFAEGGAVDCELRAYAAGLDRLYDELDILYREAFIPTAESYGLSERERFTGKVRDDLTTAQRRALLIESEQSGCGANDIAALERIVERLGITDYSVESLPRQSELDVYVNEELSDWQTDALHKQVKAFAPVTFRIDFQ